MSSGASPPCPRVAGRGGGDRVSAVGFRAGLPVPGEYFIYRRFSCFFRSLSPFFSPSFFSFLRNTSLSFSVSYCYFAVLNLTKPPSEIRIHTTIFEFWNKNQQNEFSLTCLSCFPRYGRRRWLGRRGPDDAPLIPAAVTMGGPGTAPPQGNGKDHQDQEGRRPAG